MPRQPTVRGFDWADYPATVRLWQATGRDALVEVELRATLKHDPALMLVAVADDGDIVGVVLGTYDGRRGWIHRLVVHQQYRRAGLASALVNELERRLIGRGALRINLLVMPDNAQGLAFWQRLGYVPRPDILCTKPMPGRTVPETLTPGQVAAEVRRIRPQGPVLIGIDGPGASGKSTLAEALAALLGLEVVHGDDFYKVAIDRVPTDTADGASFDLDRLANQVVRPAASRQPINYRKYDWDQDVLGDWVKADATRGLIVEGIYTTAARLRAYYDVRIYVMAPRETRLSRAIARDGEAAGKLWVDE